MTTPTGDRSALLGEIGLDHQNKAGIGRLLTTGNIGRAEEGSDGRMHARVRIGPDELAWDPAVLVMPHGGTLELELVNDDLNTHCALLPSNGASQFIWLVNHSRGTATLELAYRQRRRPRPDRRYRRAGGRAAGGAPGPPSAAPAVDRPPGPATTA